MRRPDRRVIWAGRLLIGIAVVHAVAGVLLGWTALAAIAEDGFFDAVDGHRDRGHVFWFLFASPNLALVGGLVCWIGSRGLVPPGWLTAWLAALFAATALLMPVSGAWLLLGPTALLHGAARAAPAPE